MEKNNGSQSSIGGRRFDLIPPSVLLDVAKVLGDGAEKYGEHNWKKIGSKDHKNHALNHIYLSLLGDTSEQHLIHAICRLIFAEWHDTMQFEPISYNVEKEDDDWGVDRDEY